MADSEKHRDIPLLTQAYTGENLVPVDMVMCDSELYDPQRDDFSATFAGFVQKIKDAAPSHASILYNFHFEYRSTRGYCYLRGFADAYRKTAGKR